MEESFRKILPLVLSLIIGSVIASIIGGLFLVVIYCLIWFDKIAIARLKIHEGFGIELTTISVVMFAVVYGYIAAFIFGFVIHALISGLLSKLTKLRPGPFALVWLPFIPSPENLFYGLVGLFAGFLYANGSGLIFAVILSTIIKNTLCYFYDVAAAGRYGVGRPSNVIFNAVLVILLYDFFMAIINL